MSIRNLSRALSVIARHEAYEWLGHAEISAFGAPGECHHDFERGAAKRYRLVYRRVHALTGLSWRAFVRRVRREYGLVMHPCDRVWNRILDRTMRGTGHPLA